MTKRAQRQLDRLENERRPSAQNWLRLLARVRANGAKCFGSRMRDVSNAREYRFAGFSDYKSTRPPTELPLSKRSLSEVARPRKWVQHSDPGKSNFVNFYMQIRTFLSLILLKCDLIVWAGDLYFWSDESDVINNNLVSPLFISRFFCFFCGIFWKRKFLCIKNFACKHKTIDNMRWIV